MAVKTKTGEGMATEWDRRDPDLTVELLWGRQPQPTRGPKPGLSLDRIVTTAIEIADAEGLAGLSMRRVAEELGFTTMSLYRYVPGKDELIELAVDAATGPRPDPPQGEWRVDLGNWARLNLANYRAHPWALEVPITHPPMGPNQIDWMDWALQAMTGAGLSAEEMLSVLMLLSGYVRGQAQLANTLAQVESTTGASEREWDAAYARLIGRVVAAGEHPGLTLLASSGAFGPSDETDDTWLEDSFEFGLQRILDGIAAHVAGRD
jgi:AcrR family transcriptional regulator